MKEKLFHHCLSILDRKIEALQSAFNAVSDAANNETKSTAGDKHETARAMMQLEQEKLGKQLNEAREQKTELEKIELKNSTQVKKGSLVRTDKGYFFLSIGLGKLYLDKETFYAISSLSPLGQKLLGSKVKDRVSLNDTSYTIVSIE